MINLGLNWKVTRADMEKFLGNLITEKYREYKHEVEGDGLKPETLDMLHDLHVVRALVLANYPED